MFSKRPVNVKFYRALICHTLCVCYSQHLGGSKFTARLTSLYSLIKDFNTVLSMSNVIFRPFNALLILRKTHFPFLCSFVFLCQTFLLLLYNQDRFSCPRFVTHVLRCPFYSQPCISFSRINAVSSIS